MDSNARYGIAVSFISATACGVCALAFSLAVSSFTPADLTANLERKQRFGSPSQSKADAVKLPTSELAGVNLVSAQETVVSSSGGETLLSEMEEDKVWVEVIDAVNMRSGPSNANPVLMVQLEGSRLQVASRDGRWVEVVEPNTGQRGWVFERHVKPVDSSPRRAAIAGAEIR